MENVIRCQYRGKCKDTVCRDDLFLAAEAVRILVEEAAAQKKIMTCAMFAYEQLVFLYVEYIGDDIFYQPPAELFSPLSDILMPWPGFEKDTSWAYMEPVFYFDIPQSADQWERKSSPDERCGRIARLIPEKQWGYVTHHLDIAEEGAMIGDRYQFISIHENLLFSYYETPRDREMVNVKRTDKKSIEIDRWKEADPRSHFIHFEKANGADFLTIDRIFDVGC